MPTLKDLRASERALERAHVLVAKRTATLRDAEEALLDAKQAHAILVEEYGRASTTEGRDDAPGKLA